MHELIFMQPCIPEANIRRRQFMFTALGKGITACLRSEVLFTVCPSLSLQLFLIIKLNCPPHWLWRNQSPKHAPKHARRCFSLLIAVRLVRWPFYTNRSPFWNVLWVLTVPWSCSPFGIIYFPKYVPRLVSYRIVSYRAKNNKITNTPRFGDKIGSSVQAKNAVKTRSGGASRWSLRWRTALASGPNRVHVDRNLTWGL